MTPEIWKKVPDYPKYEVSNLGRVRSFNGPGGKNNKDREIPIILKAKPNSKGYLIHGFIQNKVRKTVNLHTLVARQFVEGWDTNKECSHLDGDKNNCSAANLTWERHIDNMHRQKDHGTDPTGTRNGRCKLTLEQVNSVSARLSSGTSVSALAKELGVTYQAVWQIQHGRAWASRV